MVSRRELLQLGVTGLSATAGCLNDSRRSDHSRPNDVGDSTTKTPADVSKWTPDWTLPFDDWQVLGLDTVGGLLYATLNKNNGPSAVAAVDPTEQSILWQTDLSGEAVAGSHVSFQGISRGQWGVTFTEDTVYIVTGPVEDRRWSALHALERASGARRWSVKRQRELSVAGVTDGVLIASGREFFPPPDTTPVSHQTPNSPLSTAIYGLDIATGSVRWTRTFTNVQNVTTGMGAYIAARDRLIGLKRDGTTRFEYEHGPAKSVKATSKRIFYLTGEAADATLHGVSPNGSQDWTHDLPVNELLLDGKRLYAGGNVVAAINVDGTVEWHDDKYGQWLLLDPNRDTLYTRSGVAANAVTAYDVVGEARWTFSPPSNNAWPEAATRDSLVTTAITGDTADQPFKTVYNVDVDGQATAALGKDTVFDALGLDGTIYLADGVSNLVALSP